MNETLFGRELKELRLFRNMSQEALGRKAGTQKGYICGIERGTVNPPSTKIILKISKALEADPKRMLKLAWVDKTPELIRKDVRIALFGETQK